MMRRRSLLIAIVFTFQSGLVGAEATNHKPTLAQIEAAKKAELAKKEVADAAMQRLLKARGDLKKLTALANQAQARFQSAQNELIKATAIANKAAADYQEAAAAVAFTHREIGKLAINAYTSGGGLTDIEALLSASGPQEMIDRLNTLENLGAGNKTALKRFKAAEEIAQAAKKEAEIAKEAQRVVTLKVAAAKKEADDAKAEQQKEVDKLQAVQDKLQRD